MPGLPGPGRRPWEPAAGPTSIRGGTPTLLPLVAIVAVTNLAATSATLVGSVNPQGLSGSWWFVYGTSPTFGSSTTSTAISATSIPQTEQVILTGLTTGTLYWAAIVAQTAGGTVTSAPVQFTPSVSQPVVNPANLPTPTATAQVTIPHYQFPVQFSPTAGVATVQQDTLDEVFADVKVIAVCNPGACPELPTFGIPEPTFQTAPLQTQAIVNAIKQWEPRADETAVSQALGDPNAGTWQVTLTTGYAGSGL